MEGLTLSPPYMRIIRDVQHRYQQELTVAHQSEAKMSKNKNKALFRGSDVELWSWQSLWVTWPSQILHG